MAIKVNLPLDVQELPVVQDALMAAYDSATAAAHAQRTTPEERLAYLRKANVAERILRAQFGITPDEWKNPPGAPAPSKPARA